MSSIRDRLKALGPGFGTGLPSPSDKDPTPAARASSSPVPLATPGLELVATSQEVAPAPIVASEEPATKTSQVRSELLRLGVRSASVASSSSSAGDLHQLIDGLQIGEGSAAFVHIQRPLHEPAYREALQRWRARWSAENIKVLARDSRLLSTAADEVLFFDTETTGLGGSSTLVFLLGTIHFEEDLPILQQWLMPAPTAERPMLEHFFAFVQRFKFLASYNGRAFDVKALQDRAVLQRMRSQAPLLESLPHLDLLPPARRIWQAALPDCRLLTLEAAVLNRYRERDIEGALIPAVYYRWLHSGQGSNLREVVAHNQEDLLSLFLLGAHMLELVAAGTLGAASHRGGRHADQMLGLGTLLAARGAESRAARALAQGTTSSSEVHRYLARKRLASLHKRAGRVPEALALWTAMLAENALQEPYPYEELAKHHEHAERAPQRALEVVEQALHQLHLLTDAQRTALLARQARLERALSRTNTRSHRRPAST